MTYPRLAQVIQLCNLDTDEALKIHIEGLQSTLGKRNARIKELEEKLNQPVDLPATVEKMLRKAYKEGWKACASNLLSATKVASDNLGYISKKAIDAYVSQEKDNYNV